MSNLDKNKIFFDLVNYIFSEQMNVNWIFKTSLIRFTGLNTSLDQKAYETKSLVNDIIKYIYDVKPYHVQFEKILERYTVPNELVEIESQYEINVSIYDKEGNIIGYIDKDGNVYIDNNKIGIVPSEDGRWVGHITDSNGDIIGEITGTGLVIIGGNEIGKILEKHIKTADTYTFNENMYINSVSCEPSKEALDAFEKKDYSKYKELAKKSFADYLYLYKTQNLDDIYHILDGNYKGIEIDGETFYNERLRMGYDSFLYDTINYDSSTMTNSYYMVNKRVDDLGNIPYDYYTVPLGTSLLNFSYNGNELSKNNLHIKSIYNGKEETIYNYSIVGNDGSYSIDIFRNMKENEIIEVIIDNDVYAYVFNSICFTESDTDGLYKEIKDLDGSNTYTFSIPSGELSYRDILVYRQKTKSLVDNSIKPFNEYIRNDNLITIDSTNLNDGDIISISVIDYKLIYDKIYNDEDVNGFANNTVPSPSTVILNPSNDLKDYYANNMESGFLRPLYEKGHPSELNISSLMETTIFYGHNIDNGNIDVYLINYLNMMMNKTYAKENITVLEKDFHFGDKYISVKDGKVLEEPTKTRRKSIPGRIIVGNEIIEYYSKNGNILSQLRRGCGGTKLNTSTIYAGSLVLSYNKKDWNIIYTNGPEICYDIADTNRKEFLCPYGVSKKSQIRVYIKPVITLKSDILIGSDSFLISSNNIEMSNGRGHLYIGDDIIEFGSMKMVNETIYQISNFTTTKNYYMKDNPIIDSCIPILMNESKYTYSMDGNKIIMKNTFNKGDKIIILAYSTTKKGQELLSLSFISDEVKKADNGVYLS